MSNHTNKIETCSKCGGSLIITFTRHEGQFSGFYRATASCMKCNNKVGPFLLQNKNSEYMISKWNTKMKAEKEISRLEDASKIFEKWDILDKEQIDCLNRALHSLKCMIERGVEPYG